MLVNSISEVETIVRERRGLAILRFMEKLPGYPDSAIPRFRRWFRTQYLRTKYRAHILKKAQMLLGDKDEAKAMAALFETKQIEG